VVERTIVHSLCGDGLGDVWASVSYALTTSLSDEVRICRTFHNQDRSSLIWQISKVISEGHRIVVTDQGSETHTPRWPQVYKAQFLPVRPELRWRYPGRETICHQLMGLSQTDMKSCTLQDRVSFDRAVYGMGFTDLPLGKPYSLAESIERLSQCRLFVGIDSGYAHINYSVGAPAILIRNQATEEGLLRHATKLGTWVQSMDEALDLIRQ
jgi:hypothetical protein